MFGFRKRETKLRRRGGNQWHPVCGNGQSGPRKHLLVFFRRGIMSEITQLLPRFTNNLERILKAAFGALYRDPRDRNYTVQLPRVMTQITSYLVAVAWHDPSDVNNHIPDYATPSIADDAEISGIF